MSEWYPNGDQTEALTVLGYGLAKSLDQVLRQCGDNLTRENVVKQAANLNLKIGILLPEMKIKTGPADFAPIEWVRDDALQGGRLGVVRTAHQR